MAKYEYDCEIIRVIDGDTVVARIDLGFNTHSKQTLRLYGIDCKEIRGADAEAGKRAKKHLQYLANLHAPLLVRTLRDRKEKFGRYVATLIGQDGTNLNAQMVTDGHAIQRFT